MEKKYKEFTEKISIVMPAFNEEQNIASTVCACLRVSDELGLKVEVVVTDDGSTDATLGILEGLAKESSNLVLVRNQTNMGYGAALSSAICASSGDLIVTIDSDGQFDIRELPLLLELYLKGNKIIAGYRKQKKDSLLKVAANKCLIALSNFMFGLKLRDANSAFKLFDSRLLKSIKIESRGYQTPTEIMVKCRVFGYPIIEVGITHSFREKGKSALGTFRTAFNMIVFLIYLKLRVYLYKKKIISNL
jgi:glycosyltransferase involved in cell wall biosynthesis